MGKQWRKKHSITLLGLSLIHVLLHVALSSDFGGLYSGDQCCACGFKVRSLIAFPCLLTTIEAEAGSQCTSLSLPLSLSDSHSLLPLLTLSLLLLPCSSQRRTAVNTDFFQLTSLVWGGWVWHLSAGLCKPVSVKTFRPVYTSKYVLIQGNTSSSVGYKNNKSTTTQNMEQHTGWRERGGFLGESSIKPVKASSKRMVNAGYSSAALNSR